MTPTLRPVNEKYIYDDALQRLKQAYPFGRIRLVEEFPASHTSPDVSKEATVQFGTGNGAKINFSGNIKISRGNNKFTADGANNLIVVGSGTTLENSLIQINGEGCVVVLGDNCRIRGLKIIARRVGSMVFIGSNTTWESGAIISESGNIVAVGNDCMMSNSVVLRTSDGHTIFDKITKEPINNSKNVMIGHHVWLGNSARVNKGSCIGCGTVVGQCSIVSSSLDAASVYAGSPAKKIRDGIVWSRTHRYADIPEEFLM